MLYVTTRQDKDVYTPRRVLAEKWGNDGGLFIPFHGCVFSPEEIDRLAGQSFSETVTQLINLQFHSGFAVRELELVLGRYPVRLKKLSGRIVVAQCWHNSRGELDRLSEKLLQHLWGSGTQEPKGDWVRIALRIAILFGVYGELARAGLAGREMPFDISAVAGDFTGPVSAWYARSWGLPIGNILCCCNENSGIWNLFAHGQLRTDGPVIKTLTPAGDIAVPESLERLVCETLGKGEADRYAACVSAGATYYLTPNQLSQLRQGVYVSVISSVRMLSTVSNLYGSGGYLLSCCDALCHAGLLDYRARVGVGRCGVILSGYAPERDLETLAKTLDCTAEQLLQHILRQ